MKKFIEEVKKTAPSYGSIPFWSWNDKLEEGELRHQIRVMKGLGMNGFFMHARGGLETEYLSDDWFDCVAACVDEAEKLGMEAWSYDENGWPSGFAGGALLKDKKNFALAIEHKDGAYPDDMEDIIAVYEKGNGTFRYVTENTGKDEYLILYKRYDESYVDTLDASITEKFIELTHAEYKRRLPENRFGKGTAMPGFFTDEPQYYRWGNPWSNTLPGEFEKAYGYSIFDKLPAVFFDFEGADKFRYDYYYLIHKLFITNFIKKIYDWCEENNASLTGHAVEESSLGGQMMCVGGCMPFYEYETMPGVDYLGRGIQDDISFKQLGSACAQLGKKKALSEMFACCGWDVSPTELKRIAEVQYAGGINVMCQHLYPYSERGQRKRDYPLHYSEHNPWQKSMAVFDNYFNNLGAVLAKGEEYAPLLVIHPIHGAYCRYKKNGGLEEIEGKFFELSRTLGYSQVPYHYGDEWMMSRMAEVKGDRIKVGKCTYDAVIIPFTYSLDSTTAALLREFKANGGKIYLFAGIPAYVDGAPEDGRLDFLKDAPDFGEVYSYRDAVITEAGENVSDFRKMTRLLDDGERITFITNIGTKQHDVVEVKLPAGKWAELDMNTLETKPVAYSEYGEGVRVILSFADAESHVLIMSDENSDERLDGVKVPCSFIPVPRTAELTSPVKNVITLDTAEYSKDGINYEPALSVMGIKDNLLREKYNGHIWLKFTFEAEYAPESLKAAIEPMYESVYVNGTPVTPDKADTWFDKSFACADIASLVREGRNEIIIDVNHYQRDYVYYVLYSGVSESLRNCLVFDTEIEPIYLVGDFGVKCNGVFEDGPRCSTLYDGSFVLVKQPSVVPTRDAVRGGFAFYGGELPTAFTYSYKPGMPVHLRLDGRFATADVKVNGTPAGSMLFERTLDLSSYLKEGENRIEVTVCNSMRNSMGPHHRHDPEPYGVGPGTFSYEKEWNGRECRGYLPRYAFVKFGMVK